MYLHGHKQWQIQDSQKGFPFLGMHGDLNCALLWRRVLATVLQLNQGYRKVVKSGVRITFRGVGAGGAGGPPIFRCFSKA